MDPNLVATVMGTSNIHRFFFFWRREGQQFAGLTKHCSNWASNESNNVSGKAGPYTQYHLK